MDVLPVYDLMSELPSAGTIPSYGGPFDLVGKKLDQEAKSLSMLFDFKS